MKLRTLLLISTAVLTLTVSSIAFVTIYYLNSMDDLQKESQRLLGVRVEALNVKYFVVNIQQFLTDASVTGDEDGVKEAEENLITLNKSLDSIDRTAPEFKKSTESIRKDLNDFFQVGLEMVAAYKKKGQEAGNVIMKRSPDGFDMASEKLAEHMSDLEKKATEVQASAMELMASRQHSLVIQSIWLSIIELLIMMASFLVIFRRTFPLGDVANGLGKNEKGLESALNTLSKSAHALSGANERQALATQQTVASLDEIRALIKSTSENSSSLQERALETNQSVQVGKDALEAVITTISEINKGQHEISESVGQTNQEISNIVRLISEIGDKTKVINEIVFQTKLLAFNASVEAARAGEHGRGFAVVAEEVESLAKMSGTASKEISDLLERSVHQVEMIVEQGRQRLKETLEVSQKKIDHGTSTAIRCKESFETIVSQMESVKLTAEQNANAIHETVRGLDDISKAIEHLEDSTMSNNETSRATSSTSEELSEHLSGLKISINQINQVIGV